MNELVQIGILISTPRFIIPSDFIEYIHHLNQVISRPVMMIHIVELFLTLQNET